MKFLVDDKEVFSLTETQKKVIGNDIDSDKLDQDLQGRVKYIIEHKYKQCLGRLKKEWLEDKGNGSKLARNGVTSVPTDDIALAEVIFAQPNYKNRKQRQLEADQINNV